MALRRYLLAFTAICCTIVLYSCFVNLARISDTFGHLTRTGSLTWTAPVTVPAGAPLNAVTKVFGEPPQAPIDFRISAVDLTTRTRQVLDHAQAEHDTIAETRSVTFENTIVRLARAEASFQVANLASFLQNVSPDKGVREAAMNAEELLSSWSVNASMRHDLYTQMEAAERLDKSLLDEEDLRLQSHLLRDARRSGLLLDATRQVRLREIETTITSLELTFSSALAQNDEALWFTSEELAGVPQDLVDSWPTDVSGKYKMTFAYPDLHPVLKHCTVPATRKAAMRGSASRCANNTQLLSETLALREEFSHLLGYASAADYILEDRMAGNSTRVLDFLDSLRIAVKPQRDADLARLKEMKAQDGQIAIMYNWDADFYGSKILESDFAVDEEAVSEYFELGATLKGMLNIYECLFSLHFIKMSDTSMLWHEDVQYFATWRTDTLEFVGYLYFDLHPRDNKYQHAASFVLAPSFQKPDGTWHYPSDAIVCNFSKQKADKPSLLKHSEVRTLFHELGHGIHALVSRTKYARFHMAPAHDFIETPSTMLEYWAWHPTILKKLSNHYVTHESMPEELIQALIKTKHVLSGNSNARQVGLAAFDMHLHTAPQPIAADEITRLYNSMLTDADGLLRQDASAGDNDTPGAGTFGHIMGGYAAGYYAYHWARVYSADLFFGGGFDASPLDPELGARFRDEILMPGGARDESVMLQKFLGREPDTAAFMAEIRGSSE